MVPMQGKRVVGAFHEPGKLQMEDGGWQWLPDMDLNHDKQIQSLLCYRYTIGQTGMRTKVGNSPRESSC